MRTYILWVLALALLSVSAPAFAQGTHAETTANAEEEKLTSLEKQDWEVTKKKDWQAFDRLLSPDFVWVDDGGVIAGRSEFVKYFASVDLTGYAMEDKSHTVRT